MKTKHVAICHQSVSSGDAIGNDVCGMYDLLESMGLEPVIWCEYEGDLAGRRVYRLEDDSSVQAVNGVGMVIYHHSIHWARGEALIGAYRGRPVFKFHNITPPHHFEPYSERYVKLCQEGWEQTRRFIRLAQDHLWLADSDYNRRDLLAHGERDERVRVVPPLTRVDQLLPRPNTAPSGGAGPHYALFVGRLVPHKGHRRLLGILDAYRRHVAGDLVLCVVGAWDEELTGYQAELAGLIAEHRLPCRVLRHVAQADLDDLFRTCDVYLSASDHEGFCVPIIEAQAVGLPVVATDTTAVRDTAGEGQLVVPPPEDEGGYRYCAQLLGQVLHNADLRRTVVRNGYRNVVSRYTRELVENRLVEALLPQLEGLS